MAKGNVDKWKSKRIFEVTAPRLFNENVIAETIASDEKLVIGRRLLVNYSTVMGEPDSRQNRVKLSFIINGVNGSKATTIFEGHRLSQDFEKSLVRRRTSKVYVNVLSTTKDNQKLYVKSFAITARHASKSVKSDIGKALEKFILEETKSKNYPELITDILTNRTASTAKKAVSKVYPLRHVVIQRTEIR